LNQDFMDYWISRIIVGGFCFEFWGACGWVLNQDLQDFQD